MANQNEEQEHVEPGAARYGNFPDYYRFNPPSNRIKHLENLHADLIKSLGNRNPIHALDVGSNTGDLTVELSCWLQQLFPASNINICGVELDENLVERAEKKYPTIPFKRLNVLTDYQSLDSAYDIIFCFSVTLWIHINNGDEGLKTFLSILSSRCKYFVVEAQPWKCYRTAVRRAKRANQPAFDYYDNLKIRSNVTGFIEDFLVNECKMIKVKELGTTEWDRKLILYCNNSVS